MGRDRSMEQTFGCRQAGHRTESLDLGEFNAPYASQDVADAMS